MKRLLLSIWVWLVALFRPSIPALKIDPINPAEKVLNGQRAQALLEDPLLNAVFERVANGYRLAWETAARGEHEKQQIAHLSLAAIKDVHGAIRAHLANAKLYEAALQEQSRRDAR